MIEFNGEKCRTTKINEALALCLSVDKGLSKKENRTLPEKLEVSGWVVQTEQVEINFIRTRVTIFGNGMIELQTPV